MTTSYYDPNIKTASKMLSNRVPAEVVSPLTAQIDREQYPEYARISDTIDVLDVETDYASDNKVLADWYYFLASQDETTIFGDDYLKLAEDYESRDK